MAISKAATALGHVHGTTLFRRWASTSTLSRRKRSGRVTIHDEGEDRHSRIGLRRSNQAETANVAQSGEPVTDELLVVLPQAVHTR